MRPAGPASPRPTVSPAPQGRGGAHTSHRRARRHTAPNRNSLELMDPGVVAQPWWRPDEQPNEDPGLNWGYGGLARRP